MDSKEKTLSVNQCDACQVPLNFRVTILHLKYYINVDSHSQCLSFLQFSGVHLRYMGVQEEHLSTPLVRLATPSAATHFANKVDSNFCADVEALQLRQRLK